MDSDLKALPALVSRKARSLYDTRRVHCSEAVFLALNQTLDGGLTQETAIGLASALPEGLGGSGCLCGAVSGAVLGLGLFLGRRAPGERDKHGAAAAAKKLTSLFRERFGSPCCALLTVEHGHRCSRFTGEAAAMATELILENRPELAAGINWDYLAHRNFTFGAAFRRVVHLLEAKKPSP